MTIVFKKKPTPVRAIGLDLSTTATGIVVLVAGHHEPLFTLEHKSKLVGVPKRVEIVGVCMDVIDKFRPDVIVLEGYGLNLKNASAIVPLVELGGHMRVSLFSAGLTWFDPRPSELKKFATGKGNSPKDVVMMHVLKRFGFTPATNNIADAYVAAAMGMARLKRLPGITKDMQVTASAMEPLTV